MDYKNLKLRIFSSFILIMLFVIFVQFVDSYLFILVFLLYFFIFYEIYKNFNNDYKNSLFQFLYLSLSFIAIQTYLLLYFHKIYFIYFVIVIVLFDSSSYIFGSLFGKKSILIKISPSKTYEGLISGILITLLITFFLNNILSLYNLFEFLIYTNIFILFAFLGDVFESYFKRKANIKDSSKLIPGHGGFFDRFDSFIMSVIPLLLLNIYGL